MVNCLILYHTTISSLTKCMMLRAMFQNEDFEINVIENNTVIIYLWNVKKAAIWQAASDFESTNIFTGYGFGKRKKDAKKEALAVLAKRMQMEDPFDNPDIIKEEKQVYLIKKIPS